MNVHEINSHISNYRMMIQQTQNELNQHLERRRQSERIHGVEGLGTYLGDGRVTLLEERITEYHREISKLQKQLSSAGR